ncbi:2,3-diketo-L-gulonate reductase [Gammaproteobacteria bacterium]|nr:2,3-diketo-L-gulonate reductase [Gammaproteobacteria bacterium]
MKISYTDLKAEFVRVLLKRKLKPEIADECATMFADTTELGVFSHGVNRFPRFIQQLDAGHINPDANPIKTLSLGAIEQWDAKQSIGNLTAQKMMNRAIEIAKKNGIGVVALKNANHWMRGGTYGYQAAEKGLVGVCWTNSSAVMPPWGGKDGRIGTNPLIIAIPSDPITLVDMSMSMFSYGKLEVNRLAEQQLSIDGGFDDADQLTRDPATIEKNRRILPMGYWKGSGMSIVLDMLATLLSGGLSVAEITEDKKDEYCISQVFIAIDINQTIEGATQAEKLKRICDYVLSSTPIDPKQPVRLPGHDLLKKRDAYRKNGIPVTKSVWDVIKAL